MTRCWRVHGGGFGDIIAVGCGFTRGLRALQCQPLGQREGHVLLHAFQRPHGLHAQLAQACHQLVDQDLGRRGTGADADTLAPFQPGRVELRGAADPARVSLVNAGTNDGFGAGVMAGAAGLSEDAVVLLNNDATVRDGFLDALLAPLSEAVGATTALILLTGTWRPSTPSDTEFLVARDGSRWTRVADGDSGGQVLINSTGNEVDHAGNGYDRSWLDPANSPLPAPEVFGLCGGACAIDADAWRAVGGVRTDLFMYYEDTDLSYKLREAGYEVRFVAGAVVDHEHAASSGTSSPMFLRVNARNRIIVAAQHAPWGVVARAIARSIARAVRSGGRGPVARGVLQGLIALPRALRHRTALRPRR